MTDAEKRGRDAAISGFAHEHIAAGILMKRYGRLWRLVAIYTR